MLLPWYQETGFVSVKGRVQPLDDSKNAFQVYSFVEAAIFVVSAGVLALLFARGRRRAFHLPGGDGAVIMAAGLWVMFLIFYRQLDKPDGRREGLVNISVGVEWGIFVAFLLGALLAYAGFRIRAHHTPEPVADDVPPPGEAPPRPAPSRAALRAATGRPTTTTTVARPAAGAAARGRRRSTASSPSTSRPSTARRRASAPDFDLGAAEAASFGARCVEDTQASFAARTPGAATGARHKRMTVDVPAPGAPTRRRAHRVRAARPQAAAGPARHRSAYDGRARQVDQQRQQERGQEDQPDAERDERPRAHDVARHGDDEPGDHHHDERRRVRAELGARVVEERREQRGTHAAVPIIRRPWPPHPQTHRRRRRRPARRRLPARRVDRARLLPRRPARQAGARRGPGRRRQDRAGQGAGARTSAATLVRLQCYEGLDEAKALYEWNYRKQLLRIQAEADGHRLGGGPGRHLRRGVPARAPADDGDRLRGAGRAADRRDRQDRPGVRGDAARAAVATSRSRSPSSAASRRARTRSCC